MANVTIKVDPDHPSFARGTNEGALTFQARQGQTLLDLIQSQGIAIATYCGGAMQCQACRVHISPADANSVSPRGQKEAALLASIGAHQDERFACQAKIKTDVNVFVPSPFKDDP